MKSAKNSNTQLSFYTLCFTNSQTRVNFDIEGQKLYGWQEVNTKLQHPNGWNQVDIQYFYVTIFSMPKSAFVQKVKAGGPFIRKFVAACWSVFWNT